MPMSWKQRNSSYNKHMFPFVLTLAIIAMLLFANEWLWRHHKRHDEFSRKLIHMSVGSFAAFWPYFLSWTQIMVLSLLLVAGVLVSKKLKVFKAIHSVPRPTWGELLFAAAIGLTALFEPPRAVYALALLHLSLADGLAAVVGVRYGAKTHSRYHIFGAAKSVVGTVTFMAVSWILLIGFLLLTGYQMNALQLWGLALAATALENIGLYGLDNLLVPLLLVLVLR